MIINSIVYDKTLGSIMIEVTGNYPGRLDQDGVVVGGGTFSIRRHVFITGDITHGMIMMIISEQIKDMKL